MMNFHQFSPVKPFYNRCRRSQRICLGTHLSEGFNPLLDQDPSCLSCFEQLKMEPLVRTSGNTVYPGMVHKPEENLDTTQPYKYVVVLGDGAKKILTFESLITTPYLKQITKITTTGNGQSLKRHLKWNQNITFLICHNP